MERLGVELLALDEDGAEDDGCGRRSRSSPWRSKEEGGGEGEGRCGKMGALREGDGEIERGDRAGLSLARCMRVWVSAEGNKRC